jgi:hypothetical protein
MMVERYPNLKEEVGDSIPGCVISFLLDRKLAKWSTASCGMSTFYLKFKKTTTTSLRDNPKIITCGPSMEPSHVVNVFYNHSITLIMVNMVGHTINMDQP